MATTGTYTNRTLISDAYRKIGVVAGDTDMTSDEAQLGLRVLDRMLKSWQAMGHNLWTKAEQTLTLTTAASYTLSPVRPLQILSARLVRNGIELPMWEMTREEYDYLPNKATTGTPTQFYYDRQREDALFYIWPVLATASGETIKITYEREIEDQTQLSVVPDIPGEWWEAVVYNLAAKLADDQMVDAPMIKAQAAQELRMAAAFDREGSVYFGCEPGQYGY